MARPLRCLLHSPQVGTAMQRWCCLFWIAVFELQSMHCRSVHVAATARQPSGSLRVWARGSVAWIPVDCHPAGATGWQGFGGRDLPIGCGDGTLCTGEDQVCQWLGQQTARLDAEHAHGRMWAADSILQGKHWACEVLQLGSGRLPLCMCPTCSCMQAGAPLEPPDTESVALLGLPASSALQ